MKLYSKGQVITTGIAAGVAAVVFTTIIVSRIKTDNNFKNTETEISQNDSSTDYELQNSQNQYEALFLQTNENQKTEISENYESTELTYAGAQTNSVSLNSNPAYTQDEIQNISVYEACNEAVVNINTKTVAYDWFLEPYVQDGGSGSGSIIDKRGYVLTNVHVIQNATQIYVSLYDGTQYKAEIVGTDIDSDLAVIKFTPPEGVSLRTISFADSSRLKVGQKVIAIGNPFGMERTMTTGIVSGLGRPIQNSNKRIIRNMIQTDTAINPGNSGGPLLDTSGKMIGINTMIMSSSGSSSGVGFAVPSETAVRVVADLLKYGKVQRGVIKASIVQLNNRIAQYANLDINSGILVSQVEENSDAEKSGLKGGTQAVYYGNRSSIIYLGGDIITKIDNINIASLADYYSALESKKPGDVVNVTVRRNKRNVDLQIRLSE